MDAEFKKTGHENVAMPVLIPESLLKKEGELVNGFAPEVAWVTMGGSEKLEERACLPPHVRDDVLRPLVPRIADLPRAADALQPVVLRHPLGEDHPPVPAQPRVLVAGGPHHPRDRRGGQAETEQQLNCYADFFENVLAIPVVPGRKTDKEKFAGAEATYTIECMMKDRKALQGAHEPLFRRQVLPCL